MNAVIYLRQSADRTGEELAVSRQREDAHQLVDRRGWQVIAEHTDNDTSAAGKAKRPGFDAVLDAIATGKASVVVAWDLTRLTRNARDTLRLLEAGEKHGVTIALCRGSDMDLGTPAGRLTANVLASVARHEIEQKSDRQKRAAAQKLAAGLPVSGSRPFGYEPDRMTIREHEAAGLRQAYDAVLAGVSLGRVASELNDAGLFTPQRTRKGDVSKWTGQTVRPMLLNPRYAGLRARSIRPEQGSVTWEITGPAAWPGIIPEQTWRAASDIINSSRRGRLRPRPARSLLTGIATCGVCSEADSTVHGGRAGAGHRVYRCRAHPGHLSRKADPVDEYVSVAALGRLSHPNAVDLLIDHNRPDVDALRAEAQTYRARLDQLANDFAEGDLTASQLRIATERLRQRLAEVEQSLADAGRVNVLGPLIGAEDIWAKWDALGTDRQRAVVDALMSVRLFLVGRGTRTFRPETVEIRWKAGE